MRKTEIIQRAPVGPDGYNWQKMPFRKDPITKRNICRDCWDQDHSKPASADRSFEGKSCFEGCRCACREEDSITEERKRRHMYRREKKKSMREALAESPLAADNTNFFKDDRG